MVTLRDIQIAKGIIMSIKVAFRRFITRLKQPLFEVGEQLLLKLCELNAVINFSNITAIFHTLERVFFTGAV